MKIFVLILTSIAAISIAVCVSVAVPEGEEIVPEGMVLIFGGEFEMGSNNTPSEQPVHTVHYVFVDNILPDFAKLYEGYYLIPPRFYDIIDIHGTATC